MFTGMAAFRMSDEEFEYEYDDDGGYESAGGGGEDEGDSISIQIANAFYEADGEWLRGLHTRVPALQYRLCFFGSVDVSEAFRRNIAHVLRISVIFT